MKYNFDKIVDRKGSNSVKYELLEQRFGAEDLTPMWVADMDFETPDFIMNAIKKRLEHNVLGYTIRDKEFNNSIVNWQKKRHNWEINPDSISFSSGVVPGIVMSILGLTKPKDEIIVQPPVYFPFFTSVKDNDRKLSLNNLYEKNGRYHIDYEDLEEKAKTAKMLILCNPANPTATAWTKEELQKVADICIKNDLIVISDEIHSDLIFKPHKHIPFASVNKDIAEKTITFMAPSKTFNVAGLSTAYAIIQNRRLKKVYDSMMFKTHLFLGNILGNHALTAAYNFGEEWLEELLLYLKQNADFVINTLNSKLPKLKIIQPEATFLLWMDFSSFNIKHDEVKNLLIKKAKLALNDGATFGENGKNHFRMNIAAPKPIIEKAVNNLITTFENY